MADPIQPPQITRRASDTQTRRPNTLNRPGSHISHTATSRPYQKSTHKQHNPIDFSMVLFIPVILVIAGVAIYKESKQRKVEKRKLKAEAAKSGMPGANGHGTIYFNDSAIDVKLDQADIPAPPAYQSVDSSRLKVPSYDLDAALLNSHVAGL
ncbi:hypothetical protein LTR56_022759 [Elasticomyces elasticus]|nr:hypothetical protein LTR56_022759 [Elasticomyces elasticus]KAK3627821.1 hypothetical protein LTR22_022593 [Elasticomyces elasticus]KAK4907917.1 hypothetical protein LTR49_023120 [Elasticomyces elasticus]KAK5748045.1 hypothetical protein LTS12_021905 [Elasticomyces elasticus]